MEFDRRQKSKSSLIITPLIDVMFLLIIFFMLTTSFSRQESLELSFPTGASSVGEGVKPLILVVASNNRLFLKNEPVEAADLTGKLRSALAGNAKRKIMVMTTNEVTVQQVVNVMDEVYRAGGENIAVSYWRY